MAGAQGVRTFPLATVVGGILVLTLGAGVAHATHYPDGSRCYDCHAVSASQMVPGSHLIKMSQKVVNLGMEDGTARCLFCHERSAVSAPYSDTRDMQGVLAHFDATSTSKHPVALADGSFSPVGTALDCLDCHVGLSATVASVGGNTTIHGIDAATQDLDHYNTLLGAPADATEVSLKTCQNASCHDTDGGPLATGSAPKGHTFAAATLNDGPAPTACTDCHGTHNSYQNVSLVTLRTDGSTSNDPGAALNTRVTPDKCGECHAQDDTGAGYTTAGHGQAAIAGGFSCTACHSAGVPHAFSRSAPGSNPLRFALAENTSAQSAIRQQPPHNSVYSVCLNCHNPYANAAHKGHDGAYAGCNDCHEPHGNGVGANTMMIRATIPKVNLAGSPVYGDGSGASYETNVYAGTADKFRADGQGLCDNAECHQGQLSTAGDPIYPLGDFMAAGQHSDTVQNPGDDCSACHRHDEGFEATCDFCHAGGDPSAPQVVWPSGAAAGRSTAFGSHLMSQRGESLSASTDWSLQCNKCHTGHRGPVTVPLPPQSWNDPSGRLSGTDMQARLGIGYTATGGIRLGGTATSGATEAEICWNCHAQATNSVSEWGYNTKTTPTGFPVVQLPTANDGLAQTFNFGWLYTSTAYTTKTSDWTAGYWMDQYDTLLRRRVASVHTGSFDPAGQSSSVAANVNASGIVNRTSPTLENKAYIRCSYCHDVHDLNRAQGDAATGKPYLRGTWVGNPYPAEVPPRSTYAYTTRVNLSAAFTPRGQTTSKDRGGYFIDQNSGWPTRQATMDTLGETAGLCTLCHDTNVNTMDFYTGSKLWRSDTVNGHSNSTVGGTRTNARNLFNAVRYGTAGMGAQGVIASGVGGCVIYYDCDPNYPLASLFAGVGGQSITNSGWYNWTGPGTNTYTGTFSRNAPTPTGDYTNWYGTGTIGGASGAGSLAHEFTCSKCHTPHASGLPALLTQNCVDPSLGNFRINTTYSGTNVMANNCHRKTVRTDGWHNLAPTQ